MHALATYPLSPSVKNTQYLSPLKNVTFHSISVTFSTHFFVILWNRFKFHPLFITFFLSFLSLAKAGYNLHPLMKYTF